MIGGLHLANLISDDVAGRVSRKSCSGIRPSSAATSADPARWRTRAEEGRIEEPRKAIGNFAKPEPGFAVTRKRKRSVNGASANATT